MEYLLPSSNPSLPLPQVLEDDDELAYGSSGEDSSPASLSSRDAEGRPAWMVTVRRREEFRGWGSCLHY